MIRKTIIVLLTLAAVGTAYECIASNRKFLFCAWDIGVNDRLKLTTTRGSVVLRNYHGGGAGVDGLFACVAGEPVFEAWKLDQLWTFRFEWRAPVSVPPGLPPMQHSAIMCPLWLPFILFAAYPTFAFIRGPLRRYRRRKRGLCINCGYDLTGNESGVCSECGKTIAL